MARLINWLEIKLKNPWVVLGISLVLAMAIFYPSLFGGKVVGTDDLELNIPQLSFYKSVFLNGGTPFWNSNVAVGFPNFISIQGFPYAPFNWLLLILSPVATHYIGITLTLALGIFFSILFLRELGIGIWGSIAGAMAYVVGNIHFDRDLVLATAVLIQSLIFWSLIKIHQSDGWRQAWRYYLVGILTIGYGWLMTSYFPILYIFTGLTAFALFLIFKSADKKRAFKKLFSAIFIIFAIGTIIGSLQLIPTYVLSHYSQRSGGFAAENLNGYALSWSAMRHFFFLTPVRGLDAYLYMGIVPLLGLFFSFWSKNSYAKFFRWLFLICLAISIQKSPLFWLIVHLPVFNYFQGAARFMLVGIFGAGVLVGFGWDYIANQLAVGKRKGVIVKSAVIVSVIFGILIFNIFYEYTPGAARSAGVSLLFLAAAVVACILFLKRAALMPLLLLVAAIEFVLIFYNFNQRLTYPRTTYLGNTPIQSFLKDEPGRILPIFADDWDDQYFYDTEGGPSRLNDFQQSALVKFPTFYPNTYLLHNIQSLEVNEPLLNVDMGRLMALVGTRQLVTAGGEQKLNKLYVVENGADYSVIRKYQTLQNREALLNFLGIRYLLTYVPFTSVAYELKPSSAWKYVGIEPLQLLDDPEIRPMQVLLYENVNYRPLAYFAPVDGFSSDPEEIYELFKKSQFRKLYVECSDCSRPVFNGTGKVILDRSRNGNVKLRASTKGDQFLVFTQNYLPGWRAFIDGQEVAMHKVNTVFPGIFVPDGQHEVEFKYDYWSLFDPSVIFDKAPKQWSVNQ